MQLDVMTAQGPVRGRERKGVGLFAGIHLICNGWSYLALAMVLKSGDVRAAD